MIYAELNNFDKMRGLLLTSLIVFAIGKYAIAAYCPDPQIMRPCSCSLYYQDKPMVVCTAIVDLETLSGVFRRSAGYDFDSVLFQELTIPFIPHDIFKNNSINLLQLVIMKVAKVFDQPPVGLSGLKELEIRNLDVQGGVTWEFLGPLTNLIKLEVFKTPIKVIKKEFNEYASQTLTHIHFQDTNTRSIKSGAFEKFVNLKEFSMDRSSVKEIRRDIFPRPFNTIKKISFSINKIETVPDDMFSDMPELWFIDLGGNKLTTFTSSMFGSHSDTLRIVLRDCPIECDLKLCWYLPLKKDYEIEGQCDSPESLRIKNIRDLTNDDLHCNQMSPLF